MERTRRAALWLRDTGLGGLGYALVLVVAVSGWAASFIGLHSFGMTHMGLSNDAAWLVPITFDGAPAGLSIVVMRAATHGRPALVWRLLVVVFTALSSWINYEHIEDNLGRWVASFMPPSAVILFEGLMSEARAAAARRLGRVMPRLHPVRWFVDWSGTWEIYKAYILGLELPEALQQAATDLATGAPTGRHNTAPQSATAAATVAPQSAATGTPRSAIAPATTPATVALQKTPHGATTAATVAPQSAATGAPQSATAPATGAPQGAATATPQGATTAATVAPRSAVTGTGQGATKAARKPTRKPTGEVTRADAKQALRDLYTTLGRRPVESEMTDLLDAIGSKFSSRQYANKLRGEIEEKEPHLAALGQPNVTALTGTGP
jgi:hypothetical protein